MAEVPVKAAFFAVTGYQRGGQGMFEIVVNVESSTCLRIYSDDAIHNLDDGSRPGFSACANS